MRPSNMVIAFAATVGVVAAVRQRREAVRARAGELPRLGPHGRAQDEEAVGPVHRAVAEWQPPRARTRAGRVALAVWAAPLSAVGVLVTLAGGRIPRWDPVHGTLVAAAVRGPARWFLRQQSANAATLGQVVVVRDASADHRLLTHEALHARQQERLGLLFAVAYPVAGALWGYRRNPFEVAARTAARLTGPSGPT